MSLASAAIKAPLMAFANLSTGEVVEAQYNPEQVQIELGVNFQRLGIPGQSHALLQYIHTENPTLSLDLEYHVDKPADFETRDNAERFFLSCCYPEGDAGSVAQGGPPTILVVWPNWLALECKVTGVRSRVSRFNATGDPVIETLTVTVEEARDARLTSAEVRENGWRRSNRNPYEGP